MIGTDLSVAKQLLEADKLVAIPTETVYGLAANALHTNAVLTIYKAKNRPSFDPLIVHVSSVDWVNKLTVDVPKKALELMDAFWPGPLTLILPKSGLVPDIVTLRFAVRWCANATPPNDQSPIKHIGLPSCCSKCEPV